MIGDPPGTDLSFFWKLLRKTDSSVLLLDYDGTLAPFRVRRDTAFPYPGVRGLLNDLVASRATRVVIISGRSIEDLLPLLGLDVPPEIWGAHGRERLMSDGEYRLLPVSSKAEKSLEKAYRQGVQRGFEKHLEVKPGCLAVHFRGLSKVEARAAETAARKMLEPFTRGHDLALHVFDGGIELRAHGFDKGQAVETILAECEPGCVSAYLGDDLTDEDAFRVIKGRGLGVLVRTEWRATDADIWIRPPDELLEFLGKWNSCIREG